MLKVNSPDFSPQEEKVLKELVKGLTSIEIAKKLNLSPRTIESYRQNMIRKTNSKNTIDLVISAVQQGWLTEGA
mgnify:CR=1 FL=1